MQIQAVSPLSAPAPTTRTRLRVVPVAELGKPPRKGHVGGAHIGFAGYGPDKPGYLDFGPLVLAAMERMPGDAPGYAMHPHDNLELVTLVFEGAIAHRDSFGQDGRMAAGTFQTITAGRGVTHEEIADGVETLAMEILLRPRTRDAEPRRSVGQFPCGTSASGFVVCASGRDGAPASARPIDQDASVCVASIGAGERVSYVLSAGRRGYIVSTHAAIIVEGQRAEAGDRVLVEGGGALTIEADAQTCVLLMDLP